MKRLFQLLFISLLPIVTFSQTLEEKEVITKNYNTELLDELAKSLKSKAEFEKNKAIELAKQNDWHITKEEDGKFFELMKVSKEGNPIYYTTFNVDAAESTRANTLHNGGLLGLNVEGQNMEAHIWDAGLARITHQEYDGAGGSDRFSIGDGTTSLHYHSAHVTGTIIASGYVASAKGMAPQADAVGYEWNNDVSEATTAAGSGMLLSNHSYGYYATLIPDWYFGAYINDSRDWDIIMYNAPYYLMIVSAGNDGDDNTSNGNPLDGNSYYDKLSYLSTVKNNLVVANAHDANIDANGNLVSVSINSSSSEGPTDDYRIKPDITGNGTSLYSTDKDNNSDYRTLSGTSMSSPNVCGTLVLLQQHYNNLNSSYMKAATLKGLALHTADDAGPAGPDAVYGWGLLNGKEAANVITNNGVNSSISEFTLNQGGSYSTIVNSDGINDLIASISWTDLAGTANTGTANDPTPVLVNDLDIRVTQAATTYYPYRLTSITTNGTGDNIVDPFEKVIVSGASGTYTITVTHKGSLSTGSQAFSMIISGISSVMPPVADFSADIVIPLVGQTVTFTDLSTNSPTSWSWSFNPSTVTYVGGTNSSSQNPQVQFNSAGDYTVELTATNAGGSDTETKTNYIFAVNVPVADFEANNTNPSIGETVNFTDLSTNTPTSWSWSFNPSTVTYVGSTTSGSQNPQVQFNTPGAYTVSLIATNAGGSDTETKNNYIITQTPGLWTGNTSDSWSVASNWDDSNVPINTTNVVIPTAPVGGNYPETNSGSGAECNDLTIETGAHLYIPSNNTLTANGTLTNNAGVSGLVIKSTANDETGSLIHSTGGVNATVEKYLTQMKWHFIGMPVESEFAGVFHLPGGHSDIYLRTHIESTNTWDSWIVPVTTPLIQGRGYETWVGNGTFHQDETVEFNGVLNAGDYTTGADNFYGLQYTTGRGLNLICNPYPSALEADIDTWSKYKIANSVWTWAPDQGNYVYWNGTDGNNRYGWGTLTGGIIPSMQAFFVLANGLNPWLTIPQSNRVHSSQPYYKDSGMPNTLRLDVDGNGYKDAIFVSFNELATDEYDSDFDVKKLFGLDEAPQLYSIITGEVLSINSLSELEDYKVVNIGFECGVPEIFTIEASEIESFEENITIYLEDLKEGMMHNLCENPSYAFTHEIGDDPDRFLLHFGEPSSIDENNQFSVRIYSSEDVVYVQQPAGMQGKIIIYDMVGREILRKETGDETLSLIKVTNGIGYYLVKVQTEKFLVVEKVFIR